jgi:hypothetical protein
MVLPDPPVNVQLVLVDGQQIPVDTVYVGLDEHGNHHWHVINLPDDADEVTVTGVKMDVLPPKTTVSVGGWLP